MSYRLLLSVLLVLAELQAVAQTKPTATKPAATKSATTKPAAPKPATEAQVLQKASDLMLNRKYESAFKTLNRFDPKHRRPAVVLLQTELALNYYLRSREFEGFGFRDLGPLERLDSLRIRYTRAAIPYPFAVEPILKSLLKRYPTNYKLNRALADYYYQVLQCECAEAEKSPNTLLALIVRNYSIVHTRGYGDARSYYALGYARMSQGRFAESIPHFKRAIALRPNYALAHFNLAYSHNELKQLPQARDAARAAASYFTDDPQLKSDALFMAEDIERRLASATPATTNVDPEKKP